MQIKNIEDIEEIEESINGNGDDEEDGDNDGDNIENSKVIKKKRKMGEYNSVIVGTKVFEGLHDIEQDNDDNDDNDDNEKLDNEPDNIEGFDGFVSPTTTSYASIANNRSTNKSQPTQPAQSEPIKPQMINTTIFDNIGINVEQINLCKTLYNQEINTYIMDLSKLVKLKKNNEYLDTKKQFDVIIGRGIDNIINYISNTIKSPRVITRSSIKTDIINALSNNLETLINNTNNNLTKKMNALAMMNSTTIDYNSMLNNINDSRTQIEIYMDIDKLVINNGKDLSNNKSEVNTVLNKSFVLPIYERNFDKINQLVKSDFNENETNMANKYGRAYTDFLNEKKKDDLDINPMRLASKIESGIVDMLTNLVNSDDKKKGNKEMNSLIEESNPISEQQYKLVSDNNLNNINKDANIYKDRGNLGSYLIDKNTQKQVLEGFEDSPSTTKPSTESTENTKYEYKTKKNKINKDIVSSLMSGDFLKYIMDIMNNYLGYLTSIYNNKFSYGDGNNKDNKNNKDNDKFNLEENMIPAGFLLFILSMLIYFIDTTS
jgi:hypothetical protein